MNIQELDKAILDMEAEWKIYHHSPRDNKMPDMVQLVKLRIERRKFGPKD